MPPLKLDSWAVARRQWTVIGVCLLLFGCILMVLVWKDRQTEWRLREEQASHRLELAFELITRDLQRVRSDILNIANQPDTQDFRPESAESREQIELEFSNFLRFKQTFQQLRLINTQGQETVRVNLQGANVHVVPDNQLQDKKERYYVTESLQLEPGELFVSEFDLNQEYGVIEQPPNPVVRFVTPITSFDSTTNFLLVANYRGAPLLNDLSNISLPGKTYLIRDDSEYLLGPEDKSAWGWLLGHGRNFSSQFPVAWNQRFSEQGCLMTSKGAFAFREIRMRDIGQATRNQNPSSRSIVIVSHLPTGQVFATSDQLRNRLLILVAVMFLPLYWLARFWAVASLRRIQQNAQIQASEKRLRELSSRLVKIQEDERRAISREIHDQLGQQATAINLDLKLAQRKAPSEELTQQIQRTIDESEHLIDTLHDFATRIRPVELDDLGLHDAIESHLWEFKQRSGIDADFRSNIDQFELAPVVSENVYRLIQESLNNILKHAQATNVLVEIHQCGSDQNRLSVKIHDDGIGTVEPNDTAIAGARRLGILGMRERVDLMGGTIELDAQPGQGTIISVNVPLEQENDPVDDMQPTKDPT